MLECGEFLGEFERWRPRIHAKTTVTDGGTNLICLATLRSAGQRTRSAAKSRKKFTAIIYKSRK